MMLARYGSLLLGMLLLCVELPAQMTYSETKDRFIPCDEMPRILHNYNVDLKDVMDFYIVKHSPEKSQRLRKLYADYLAMVQQIDFNSLSQECKADYILFTNNLNENIRLLDVEEQELDVISQWFPFTEKIYAVEKSRRRGIYLNAQRVALDFYETMQEVKQLTRQLEEQQETLDPTSVVRAGETIDGLKTALNSVMEFYNGHDPQFTWWVPVPHSRLDSALNDYRAAFDKKMPHLGKYGIVARTPVGQVELDRLLQHAMIPYNVEELIKIAEKEFAWCEKEFIKVANAMGFGDDWKAAIEQVKDTYVEAGRQPEAILELYTKSVDFLKQHDLITIPPLMEEVWGMRMRPSERGSAAFFQGGKNITITYPTNNWWMDFRMASMRGNNPNFSFATVHHELIPGHNTTFYMDLRHRSYRQSFRTSFSVEGWALYWELLLWDLGFPQTNEEKIGMLFWRMHRSARILFSSNFQMGNWTPEQCVDFLVERVGHELGNAISQVAGHVRPNNYPLYQLSYLVGGLQYYALKAELVDSGKMALKDFHDSILTLGSMPVDMARNILTDQKLTKDYKPTWLFYNL